MGHITDVGRLVIIDKIISEPELSDSAKLVAISAVVEGARPLTYSDVSMGEELQKQFVRDFE
jgi:hypothetical protein